ncbi:MAG TPA: glycosyltransferase family 2 protein [Pirellulales bacterium]|nr:glycosyltransferase family 2 protein [Pirellulales bacterium]
MNVTDQPEQLAVSPAPVAPAAAGELPFISVVLVVRNEARFISRSMQQVFAQDYPRERMEVIVADGMSDDGTREILADLQAQHPQLTVVDNPKHIVASGLNIAIARARGELIVRIDGHCEVATDFVSQAVRLMAEHPEAWCTGGPIVHAGTNRFGEAVAVAMSHPLGVGLATHRFPNYEGYAEGAQFPTFRRWIFDRIGYFDEDLVRTEDDEFNYRIAQAGGKVFVSPRVRYVYFVRETWSKLFRQYIQYSFWRIPVVRKHKKPTTLRQVVPPLFFLTMFALLIAGIWLRQPWIALALPAVYAAALVCVGLSVIPRKGLAVGCLVPVALATIHFAYALGIAYGMFALLFHPHAWDLSGRMSALNR